MKDAIVLETDTPFVEFKIRTHGAAVHSINREKIVTTMRVNQKYAFRVNLIGSWQVDVPDNPTQVIIYADFILAPDKTKLLYPPFLME